MSDVDLGKVELKIEGPHMVYVPKAQWEEMKAELERLRKLVDESKQA